jgi:hypothetical protein
MTNTFSLFSKASNREAINLLSGHFDEDILEIFRHVQTSSYFCFGNVYKQKAGGAVASPLSPVIARFFMDCNVYRKPTHTNTYLNCGSHYHPSSKYVVLSTLVHRARAHGDQNTIYDELELLSVIFKQNSYSDRKIRRALYLT